VTGAEARRSLRVAPRTPTPALDVMWDRVLGFVQDLSSGGLKLLSHDTLVDEGLYQLQLPLDLGGTQPEMIEAGVQVVSQRRGADGGTVAGLRFIHLPKTHAQALSRWLERQAPRPG
jgi:hypothetical protein